MGIPAVIHEAYTSKKGGGRWKHLQPDPGEDEGHPEGDCGGGSREGARALDAAEAVREGMAWTGHPGAGRALGRGSPHRGCREHGVGEQVRLTSSVGAQPPPCPLTSLPVGTGGSGIEPGSCRRPCTGGLLTTEKQAWVPSRKDAFMDFLPIYLNFL